MTTLPKLGPFRLQRPLAKGGMAVVWRAVHERHGEPVAIKIMMGEQARKERVVDSFHREVRVVARMNHPNIVPIFDYGEIPEEVAEHSEGHLVVGSPYMVMELANSTLAHIEYEKLRWHHVHTILVQILDALAHAHARGLVHRDLKPDNVLLRSGEGDAKLKLSDFGVVYAIESVRQRPADDEVITGTPRFMAPEQIRGRSRQQGPWTDLYALGCLAYWLSAGEPPFSGQSVAEILRCHLLKSRPPLKPFIEVPEGFDQWAHRLIAHDRSQRFQRAADASAALVEIAGRAGSKKATFRARDVDGEALEMTVVEDPDATRILDQIPAADSENSVNQSSQHGSSVHRLPEIPKRWCGDSRDVATPELIGVGLNLFELREIPLIGRHDHRELLWEDLVDTRHTERPHVAVLQGPAGIGKTRLASWIGHRAHEVGAVALLTAHHSPIAGPADGISRMFSNHLRCTGLSRPQILEQVREFYGVDGTLDGDDLHQCMALTDLLAPGADPGFDASEQRIEFTKPEERFVVWKRLLATMSRRRPALLMLDDVHWGSNTLRFVNYLMSTPNDEALPVLMVLTAREDIIDEHPVVADTIADIVERPCAHKLCVGPLGGDEHRELVENLLLLEPGVAERVARRTDGNPLFAIQLVGDWVERGILEVGDDGFRLVDGQQPPLPEDIQSLLIQRVEKIIGQSVDDPPGLALLSLELAATLGHDVDDHEWHHLCELGGTEPIGELLRMMAVQSLIQLDERGWSFAHGAMRETLLAVAKVQGRYREHHRLCAQMLRQLYDTSQDKLAPRLSRHLLEAGLYEQATEPLFRSLRHYVDTCDFEEAERFLKLHRNTRAQLDIEERDPRAVRVRLQRARLRERQMDFDRSEYLLQQCQKRLRPGDDPDLMADIYLAQVAAKRAEAKFDEAIQRSLQAQSLYESAGNKTGVARSLANRGWSHFLRGEFDEARALTEDARSRFEALGDTNQVAKCLHSLAGISLKEGEAQRAIELYRRVEKAYEARGDQLWLSGCFNGYGEAYRQLGNLSMAEKMYRRAIELRRRTGAEGHVIPHFNLGITRLDREDFEGALSVMEIALACAQNSNHITYRAFAHTGLVACHAALSNWECFERHFDQAQEHLAEISLADGELAGLFRRGAGHALRHGEPARARRAYKMACAQWREVGDSERVQALESRLASLEELKE